MASILEGLNAICDAIVAGIAPYQPNSPPTFPNTAATAGTIPNTVCGPGHPIQFPVTTTLEQGNAAEIAVYDTKPEKVLPIISSTLHYVIPGGQTSGSITNVYKEVGRSLKEVCLEIWAYKAEDRAAIQKVLRGLFGDVARITMYDGTVLLLKYTNSISEDFEQVDSMYISQMRYMMDITETVLVGSGTDLGTGYLVTETQTFLQPEDVLQNPIGPTFEKDYP